MIAIDIEVVETISGMPIPISFDLKQNNCYLIGGKETEFIDKGITSLHKKEWL